MEDKEQSVDERLYICLLNMGNALTENNWEDFNTEYDKMLLAKRECLKEIYEGKKPFPGDELSYELAKKVEDPKHKIKIQTTQLMLLDTEINDNLNIFFAQMCKGWQGKEPLPAPSIANAVRLISGLTQYDHSIPDAMSNFMEQCDTNEKLLEFMTRCATHNAFFALDQAPNILKPIDALAKSGQEMIKTFKPLQVAIERLREDQRRLMKEVRDALPKDDYGTIKNKNPAKKDESRIDSARKKILAIEDLINDLQTKDTVADVQSTLKEALLGKQELTAHRQKGFKFFGKIHHRSPKFFQRYKGHTDPLTGKKAMSSTHNHLIDAYNAAEKLNNRLCDVNLTEKVEKEKKLD